VNRIVVVTGANRGIGLEVSRELAEQGDTVIAGSRDLAAGQRAVGDLVEAGRDIRPRRLDVIDQGSIDAVADELARTDGHVDVLVNNAAIHYDTWQRASRADLQVVWEALDTNLIGAWRTAEAMIPLLRASRHGRIVNVSSEAGSLASMGAGTPAYATSKAALNALTCMLAADLRADDVLVNSVCPGWVATDMGGPGGRPVAEGAASVLWAVDLPDDGPTGGFYRDGHRLPW
jgi:NAD(P)-dependent dehydrogenase (short-subunit alcohol dehydrogenase family)